MVGLAVVDIQKLSTLLSRFVNQSFCCFYTFLIQNRQFLEPVDTKAIPFWCSKLYFSSPKTRKQSIGWSKNYSIFRLTVLQASVFISPIYFGPEFMSRFPCPAAGSHKIILSIMQHANKGVGRIGTHTLHRDEKALTFSGCKFWSTPVFLNILEFRSTCYKNLIKVVIVWIMKARLL